MVRGVDKFKEYFKNYTGQYTFIGGTACDIILGNLGEDFRATKDLDMVLILEELSEEFASVFILFIEDGGYEHIHKGTRLGPIHISDEAISLSAILLDDEYYEILKNGVTVVDDVSVLDLEHIVLFKMKAWLDLSERKENGEPIDSKNIKKHKNDIFRLIASIDRNSRLPISGHVRQDAEIFMAKAKTEPIDIRNLDIKNVTYDEILNAIAVCYELDK